MTTAQARTAFFAFAAVMGVSMASIFLVFTGTSIALAFFSAAAVFAAMSLWGYTTNVDLSRWSTFLMVGLIGVVIASIVNLFVGSSTLQLVFSIVGVLVFTGLTAWDTQRLKSEYLAYAGSEQAEKLAVMGALSLYLNLVNLFQLLLSLFGQRRNDRPLDTWGRKAEQRRSGRTALLLFASPAISRPFPNVTKYVR
jgi:FtsH-binding integral membrane protein